MLILQSLLLCQHLLFAMTALPTTKTYLPARSDKEPMQDVQSRQGRLDAAGCRGALLTQTGFDPGAGAFWTLCRFSWVYTPLWRKSQPLVRVPGMCNSPSPKCCSRSGGISAGQPFASAACSRRLPALTVHDSPPHRQRVDSYTYNGVHPTGQILCFCEI